MWHMRENFRNKFFYLFYKVAFLRNLSNIVLEISVVSGSLKSSDFLFMRELVMLLLL